MLFLCALNSDSIEPQWKVSSSDVTTSVVLLSFRELSSLDLRDTVKFFTLNQKQTEHRPLYYNVRNEQAVIS